MRKQHPAVFLLAMILGISATSVSCSPESTSPREGSPAEPALGQSAQSLHERYAWTGSYHNDALAFALGKIKQSKRLTKYDKCKAGLAALKDFQKEYRRAGGPPVFDDLTITDGMCEAAGSSTSVAASRSLDASGRKPSSEISAAANDYMNQIAFWVDFAPSSADLAAVVSQIEAQAAGSVDALEAASVATTGSIALSSTDYWTVNETSWLDSEVPTYTRSASGPASRSIDLVSTPPAFSISPRTRRIIKADVMAAIAVLLYDWWMGEAAIGKAAIKAAAASLIAGIYAT